jgi:hypothetical protein
VSYPRGAVALDPASVLPDGQAPGRISTGARFALGVQGSVPILAIPLRPASRTGSPLGGSLGVVGRGGVW